MRLVTYLSAALFGVAVAVPIKERATSYDYVIVGCGTAGLVIANRLSANPTTSVLCIEAGPFDALEAEVVYPFGTGLVGGIYDWNIGTVPQTQLNGATRAMPVGHVVGGGTVINGMVWNRGNVDDFDAWDSLQGGNSGWSWSDLLPYFIRSETYTPKTYAGENPQPITYDSSVHGTRSAKSLKEAALQSTDISVPSGPVQVSYPNYYWPQSDNWFQAMAHLNIPLNPDPDAGLSAGGYFLAYDIDPDNQTRCDARIAYYDPVQSRSNLQIMPNTHVTRILFDTSSRPLVATGVEYATGPASALQTATASAEVIVSAGALHSPQVLELSGIGSPAVLQAAGVDVLHALPGVGANFQDHPLIHLDYPYTNTSLTTPYTVFRHGNNLFNFQYSAAAHATALNEYLASKTGPLTAIPSNALAFPSLPQISAPVSSLIASASGDSRYYPSDYDTTLQSGYEAQLSSLLARLALTTTPAFENLNNNAGGLDISLQHPLSRGTVHITNNNPFTAPAIDPRWLTNPFDRDVMVLAMQFNQRILDTPTIQELQPSYPSIPRDATAGQLSAALDASVGTEYHYSGTCAMIPLNHGGVVNVNLVVYGTSNVRVVDTSVFPMIPTAHLSAVVYAVAEKASDLILAAQ